MTREEQIEREALLDYDAYADNNYHAFKRGVAWADENPNLYNDEKYHTVKVSCLDELNRKAALYDTFLEKACEWLKKELIDNRDNFGYNVVSSFDTFTLNEFIEEFKKAMEE
jgi:hypothetical protein